MAQCLYMSKKETNGLKTMAKTTKEEEKKEDDDEKCSKTNSGCCNRLHGTV